MKYFDFPSSVFTVTVPFFWKGVSRDGLLRFRRLARGTTMAIPKMRLPRVEKPRLHVEQPKSSFAEGNARWSVTKWEFLFLVTNSEAHRYMN